MKEKSLTEDQIEQIAVLLAEQGMRQMQIADRLKVSRTTISRAVEKAFDKEMLLRTLEVTDKVQEKNRDAVRRLLNINPLEEALKAQESRNGTDHFRELQVFDSGPPQETENYTLTIRTFAKPMAAYLSKHLKEEAVTKVGISWGETIFWVAQELKRLLPNPPRVDNPLDCISIAGSPPEVEQSNKKSSAHLAGEFSRILHGEGGESSSFSVGAWIPAKFSPRDVGTIKDFCFTSPSYERAFSKDGLVNNLNCLITSVGATKDFERPWLHAAAKATKLSVKEFRTLTVGNITGCFLPKPELKAQDRKILDDVNFRWLGIQFEQIRKCAKAGSKGTVPGVVLIAIGEGKAELVLEAIRLGLVSILCADQRLSARLQALMGIKEDQ